MPKPSPEAGNILFYVLIGIVLIGALTVALRQTGDPGKDIDQERLVIKATDIQRYGAEIQQGVASLTGQGLSEGDIRFAHPDAPAGYGLITADPEHQVFGPRGGKVSYKQPPSGVNDGSSWEFYGTSDIPQVGSDKADLIAVLPKVTLEFCEAVNRQLGFSAGSLPVDNVNGSSPDCIYSAVAADGFTGTFSASPNKLDAATFTRLPALQGCAKCASSNEYHYFYVLLAR